MNIKETLKRLPRIAAYYFIATGILDIVSIPLVGRLLAGLLDGIAFGAEATADVVRYASLGDAQQDMEGAIARGARVLSMYHNGENGVAVKYDLTDYNDEV